jgi:hypothetical protein
MKDEDFFIDTFNLVRSNLKKAKYRVQNKNFSPKEKIILKAFIDFRNNKVSKALLKIEDQTFSEASIAHALGNYVKGLCLNQIGQFNQAQISLTKSYDTLINLKNSFSFYPLAILVINMVNQNKKSKAYKYLVLLKSYKIEKNEQFVIFNEAQFAYDFLTNETKKIISKGKDIIDESGSSTDRYSSSILLIFIMSYIKEEDFVKAYNYLGLYKNFNGPKVKSNYKFMKILLEHILGGDEIYVYERDFVDESYLFNQLKLIKELRLGEINDSKETWKSLSVLAPDIYGEDFNFKGDKCLFSILLKKYNPSEKIEFSLNEKELVHIKSIQEKFEYILNSGYERVSKEQIAHLIWPNDPYHEVSLRINKYVSKLRQIGYDLEVKNECIHIHRIKDAS